MTRPRAYSRRLPTALIARALATAAIVSLGGCMRLGIITSADANLTSTESAATLSPDLRVRVFTRDQNDGAADLYFTDLTDEQLDSYFDESGAWTQISGNIVHVHLFIKPYAGRTPIETTAANASVRWAVLSKGEIGVYTGAGFLLPGKSLTGSKISGSISEATLRLTRATAGFHDPLGPAKMSMGFTTPENDEMAEGLSRRLDAAARRATKVAEPE